MTVKEVQMTAIRSEVECIKADEKDRSKIFTNFMTNIPSSVKSEEAQALCLDFFNMCSDPDRVEFKTGYIEMNNDYLVGFWNCSLEHHGDLEQPGISL